MTSALQGEVDGLDLSALSVGQTYDLPSSLAMYLVVTRSAEMADADSAVQSPRIDKPARRRFVGDWPGWAVAADWIRPKPDSSD